MIFTIFISFLIARILPIIHTPLRLGLWIIILAIFISINFSYFISSWFAFITFLIYIGGLLVIFAYFIAIDPNKKIKLLDPLILPLILSIIMLICINQLLLFPLITFSENNTTNYQILLHIDYLPILFLIAISLLIALIAVVKITIRSLGALRPYL